MTQTVDYKEECELLRERIANLEEILGIKFESPPILKLTVAEEKLLGFMLKRPLLTKDAALTCLYGSLHADDEPDIKIVDVFICKLRKKLKPFKIAVETLWGRGYYLTPQGKAKLETMMREQDG